MWNLHVDSVIVQPPKRRCQKRILSGIQQPWTEEGWQHSSERTKFFSRLCTLKKSAIALRKMERLEAIRTMVTAGEISGLIGVTWPSFLNRIKDHHWPCCTYWMLMMQLLLLSLSALTQVVFLHNHVVIVFLYKFTIYYCSKTQNNINW